MTPSRRIVTALLGTVLSTGTLLAPTAAPAYAVPAPCQADYNTLQGLNSDLDSLQEELKTAAPPAKPHIAAQIKAVKAQIAKVQPRYEQCMRDNDAAAPPIQATFTGRVTLTTNDSRMPKPITRDVSIGLSYFGQNRELVNIREWPTITSDPIQAGPFNLHVTVRLDQSSGSFNRSTGRMSLNLVLTFDEDLAAPADSDSNLAITVGTDQPGGVPMDAAGNVTLAGADKFYHGHLNDKQATITVTGAVSPRP
ncbi:hypothetical protein [Krasilnikovia sp. MM14-A1259]|uniref:hypothetical protein n=1 Tax=Krasilnikovia sp. MM14-A1259 TaxID=3373539 RepID=UPI0037F3F5B4